MRVSRFQLIPIRYPVLSSSCFRFSTSAATLDSTWSS